MDKQRHILTEDIRDRVKNEYIMGQATLITLADKYNVNRNTLYNWCRKERWVHEREKWRERKNEAIQERGIREIEESRVKEVALLNDAIGFLLPYVRGVMRVKPRSHIEATRAITDLIKTRELLTGRATDIILTEIRDRKLVEIIHKIRTIRKTQGESETLSKFTVESSVGDESVEQVLERMSRCKRIDTSEIQEDESKGEGVGDDEESRLREEASPLEGGGGAI